MTASPPQMPTVPTPVERVAGLSAAATAWAGGAELWVKRDDRTHPVYGGNKVRKLEGILAAARARAATRLVTVGAAGSHHVLATAYFGREAGLEVEAVLVPQPRTEHVARVLRASVGCGVRAFPVGSWAAAAPALGLRRLAGGGKAMLVPVGGSSVAGSMGYVEAARELAAQVRAGELPEPGVCVVALGSGGTAAGLAAGFALEGLATRVVGVSVSDPAWLVALVAHGLARACVRRGLAARRAAVRAAAATASGPTMEPSTAAALLFEPAAPRLSVDARFLGGGYAHPTAEGREAIALAAEHAGLALDPTYTGKAFASALWHVRARRASHVLYWHTLSSAPLDALFPEAGARARAPDEASLDPRLRALLLPALSA